MTAPRPRPGILDIDPYIPGEGKAPGAARVMKLSANEGALGPSPRASAAYRALADDLHRYPDGSATELRAAIAHRHGLDADRIVCGAGSDELLQILAKSYAGPGDEVLYSQYGFMVYPIAAKAAGATPVTAPETGYKANVDALLASVTPRTRIVFLANPNNPTGTYLPLSEVRRLHAGLDPSVLLVLDAAYAEYVTRNDYGAGEDLVSSASNVVMTRTFSKIHALAALRLGWAYCPPAVADVLNRVRGPFNVGSAALAAGVAAIEDHAFLELARAHNDVWMPWLTEQLTALGLEVVPSVGNFLLVGFPSEPGRDANAAFDFLRERGIIVRKMGGYGLPATLRVTVGPADETRAVAEALGEFVKG